VLKKLKGLDNLIILVKMESSGKAYKGLKLPEHFDPIRTNYRVAGMQDGIKGLAYSAAFISAICVYFVDPLCAFGISTYFVGKLFGWSAENLRQKTKRMEWAQQECYDNSEAHYNFMKTLREDSLDNKL